LSEACRKGSQPNLNTDQYTYSSPSPAAKIGTTKKCRFSTW
jgi:hypothetical protein